MLESWSTAPAKVTIYPVADSVAMGKTYEGPFKTLLPTIYNMECTPLATDCVWWWSGT